MSKEAHTILKKLPKRFNYKTQTGYLTSLKKLSNNSECTKALGMQNHAIPDGKISASTQWDPNHAARQARLNFPGGHGKAGSWSSRYNDGNQWLQIDLGIQNIKVTGFASQGRADLDQWVTKYKLQYSHDGVNFYYYKEPGQGVPKVSPPINSLIWKYSWRLDLLCLLWQAMQLKPHFFWARPVHHWDLCKMPNRLSLCSFEGVCCKQWPQYGCFPWTVHGCQSTVHPHSTHSLA